MSAFELRFSASVGKFDLQIDVKSEQKFLLVLGENGSGKSSLLKVIAGLVPIARGFVAVDGTVLGSSDPKVNQPVATRRLGYVPQSGGLFPHMSVLAQLKFALDCDPLCPSAAEKRSRLEEQIEALELSALTTHFSHQLSGGQAKRVALARALIQKPRALLLDEPLSSLDVRAKDNVRGFLGQHLEKLALPIILVSHEPADLAHWPENIAIMEAGRLSKCDSLTRLARPESHLSATGRAFLSHMFESEPSAMKRQRSLLERVPEHARAERDEIGQNNP